MTDSQNLLAEYVQTGSDAAFCELVTRYLDLVYWTAFRLVEGDAHRAEDVAQTVFVDLTRKARTLSKDVMLGGWLHRHTCFVAANTMRGERRRRSRERQAVEMNALQNNAGADFPLVAPILDEAINELGEEDRKAVLLRFFEQQDLRSLGQALGSTEDAARMRVARALDKLQGLLKRRGVTTSSATLSLVLSANAVQAAPVGLAVTISTAAALAGTTIATTAIATATKTIAMTTLQKTVITVTIAAVTGWGIYEARQAATARAEAEAIKQQPAPLAEQIQQLTRERDDFASKLAALHDENDRLNRNTAELLRLRGEVGRLRNDANDPTDVSAKALVAKVNKLKQRLEETPSAKIPELQFVTEKDWLNAARGNLETDADYRRALSTLRNTGEKEVAVMLKKALAKYMQSNNQQFPTDLGQLQPYFDSPVEDAILQRWQIASAATLKNLGMGGDVIITQKAPVDDVFDTRYGIGPNGYGSTDYLNQETEPILRPVSEAFRAAHNGQRVDDLSQLQPYVTTPEQQVALQKLMLKNSAEK